MPFIGNTPDVNFTSFAKQDLTGVTGSPAKRGYTLTHAVANANEIEVFVNNVRQEPTEAYTVNGTGLTMTGDVETSDDFYIIYLGKAIQTTVPPDGSVSTAKIADSAVSTAKIASSAVDLTSKVTGVLPVANGGTGQSTNTEVFRYGLGANLPLATSTWAIAPFNTALFGLSNSNFNTSTYRYTVPTGKAGVYKFETEQNWITAGDFDNFMIAIYKNSGGTPATGTQIGFSAIRQEAYENSIAIAMVRLAVGDTVDVHIRQESGNNITFRQSDSSCWFQGMRIGE